MILSCHVLPPPENRLAYFDTGHSDRVPFSRAGNLTKPYEMTTGIKRLTYSTFGSYDDAEAENDEEHFLQSTSDHFCPLCKTAYRHFTHLLNPVPIGKVATSQSAGLALLPTLFFGPSSMPGLRLVAP
jgi:hypothetical protein